MFMQTLIHLKIRVLLGLQVKNHTVNLKWTHIYYLKKKEQQ